MKPSQTAFEVHDKAFGAVLGDAPRLVKAVDFDAHEGPVNAAGTDSLFFTTMPPRQDEGDLQVAIKRLSLDGYRFPLDAERVEMVSAEGNAANGMALDGSGCLLVREQGASPGNVEYHGALADFMRVVRGSATVLTGGTMVEEREVAGGEVSARAVLGGTTQTLSEEDVPAVPAGVPDHFIEGSDPFLYYGVKGEM